MAPIPATPLVMATRNRRRLISMGRPLTTRLGVHGLLLVVRRQGYGGMRCTRSTTLSAVPYPGSSDDEIEMVTG